jgi:hypothetical protein
MSNHFDKALHDLFPIDERYGVYVAYRSHRRGGRGVPVLTSKQRGEMERNSHD